MANPQKNVEFPGMNPQKNVVFIWMNLQKNVFCTKSDNYTICIIKAPGGYGARSLWYVSNFGS